MVICNAALRGPKAVLIGLVEVDGSIICTRAVMLWMPSASVSVDRNPTPAPVGPPWLPTVSTYKCGTIGRDWQAGGRVEAAPVERSR